MAIVRDHDEDVPVLDHVRALLREIELRNEQRFVAQRQAVDAALAAADRAVLKAEAAAEKRFEGVNEFRGQLADQQRTLMPRSEAEIRLSVLSDRMSAVEKAVLQVSSRGIGAKDAWGWVVGVIGFVLSVLALLSMLTRMRVAP